MKKILGTKWFSKVSYAVWFIVCFAICIKLSIFCFVRYFNFETAISLDIVSTGNAKFPSMTVCPHFNAAYRRNLLQNLFQLEVDQVRKKLIFPKIEILNKSLSQFYRHVTFEWEDLVERISIKTGAKFGDTNFTIFVFVNTDSNSSNITNDRYGQKIFSLTSINWEPQYYLLYGRCFTFNVPNWLRELRILDITMELKKDSYIFVHHKGQFTSTDTKTKIEAILAKALFIDVYHDITIDISKQVSGLFHKKTCVDYSTSNDYDVCIDAALKKEMLRRFSCSVPFLKIDDVDVNVTTECRLDLMTDAERKNLLEVFTGYYKEGVRNHDCPLPCSVMTILFGYPFLEYHTTDKIGLVKMYFKSAIGVRKAYYAYSVLSLIAEIGGYIGLFLGISLLKISAIFENLFK